MPDSPDTEWVWKHRTLSYREMGVKLGGMRGVAVRGRLRKLGFKRHTNRAFILVPCSGCGAQMPADDLWLCDGCPKPKPVAVPEWKKLYDRELARVMEKREAERERLKAWIRERMAKKPTYREMVGIMAPRDAA